MRWQHLVLIFKKEIISTLRDRRTLLGMIILPIFLIPAVTLLGPSMIEKQTREIKEKPPKVALIAPEESSLSRYLRQTPKLEIVSSSSVDQDLEDGKIQAIIRIEPGFDASIAQHKPAPVIINFDASDQKSSLTSSRVAEIINEFSQGIVAERLAALKVDTTILSPIALETKNVVPEEKVGGSFLGLVFPLMLAVWAAMGGMYAAIDAGAGEKERGTMEPLLAAPISRLSLVMGKYFAVVLMSIVGAAVALVGMYVAFLIKPGAALGPGAEEVMKFSIPWPNALVMMLIALTIAGFFSALELAVSILARSYREANTYLSPLSFAVVIPAIFTQFLNPRDMPEFTCAIPLFNAIMVFKELLMNEINWGHIGATLAWSCFWIVLALRFAVYMFNRESVLFRQ